MNYQQQPEHTTGAVVDGFGEVFNRRDADALAALLAEDTVFENTSPAPDGDPHREQARANCTSTQDLCSKGTM